MALEEHLMDIYGDMKKFLIKNHSMFSDVLITHSIKLGWIKVLSIRDSMDTT